jgi:mono/diheme cytochrome c family protein
LTLATARRNIGFDIPDLGVHMSVSSGNRRRSLTVFALVAIGVFGIGTFFSLVVAQTRKSVWDGVYALDQASRGKSAFEANCVGCHGVDLGGLSGPELAGDGFRTKWDFQTVNQLFTEIKTRMPRNNPATLGDETYLNLVTYILQANAFPPGTELLTPDSAVLSGLMIQKDKSGQPTGLSTGSLVQVVGCLSQEGSGWLLTNATAPRRTDDPDASKGEQRAALVSVPLGAGRIGLLGVYGSLEAHKEHKMEAKGFLVREAGGDRINVAALEVVAAGCG